MNAEIADYSVMVVFGTLLGVVLNLFGILFSARTRRREEPRRSMRQRIADAFDREKVRAENKARLQSAPRSAWLALVSFYGLVAMLVVVVKVSPVTMRWWPFLGSILLAHVAVGLIYTRTAAASRRKADSPS